MPGAGPGCARLCPQPLGQPQGCRVQAAGKCRHLRGSRRSAGSRKARPLSPAGRGVQRLRGHGVPRLAAGGHQPGQDRLRGRLRPRQQGRGPLHPAEAVPRAPVPAREDPQQGARAPRAGTALPGAWGSQGCADWRACPRGDGRSPDPGRGRPAPAQVLATLSPRLQGVPSLCLLVRALLLQAVRDWLRDWPASHSGGSSDPWASLSSLMGAGLPSP